MVQTYGAAAVKDINSELIESEEEESLALLGSHSSSAEQSRADGHATLLSSISNLLNTIIGSGV